MKNYVYYLTNMRYDQNNLINTRITSLDELFKALQYYAQNTDETHLHLEIYSVNNGINTSVASTTIALKSDLVFQSVFGLED